LRIGADENGESEAASPANGSQGALAGEHADSAAAAAAPAAASAAADVEAGGEDDEDVEVDDADMPKLLARFKVCGRALGGAAGEGCSCGKE
jgi:hypothetical protein